MACTTVSIIKILFLCLLVVDFAAPRTLQNSRDTVSKAWPTKCLLRQVQYNHTIYDPETNILCTGRIRTWGCYGACSSSEYDTPNGFKGEQHVCTIAEYDQRETTLNCPDVAAHLRTVTFYAATACKCQNGFLYHDEQHAWSIAEYEQPKTTLNCFDVAAYLRSVTYGAATACKCHK